MQYLLHWTRLKVIERADTIHKNKCIKPGNEKKTTKTKNIRQAATKNPS